MPTPDGQLAIQQLQQLAQNIRAGSQAFGEGQQRAIGLQQQQQLGQQARERQVSDVAEARRFQVGEREASQAFRQELQAEELKTRKEVAGLRRAETQININTDQARSLREQEALQSAGRAGFLTPGEEGQPPVLDVKKLARADTQAVLLGETILNLTAKSEEQFQAFSDDENIRTENLRKEAARARVDSPALGVLRINPGENKEQYLVRLRGFRNSLIQREFQSRLAEERKNPNFGKEIQQSTRAGVVFGPFSPAQAAKDEENILARVTEEFGGNLGE